MAFLVSSFFIFSFRISFGDTAGVNWVRYPQNPLIQRLIEPSVIYDGHMFKMWCSNFTGTYEVGHPNYQICYASSPNGILWTVYGVVLDRGDVGLWDHHFVREPIVLFDGSLYRMWYLGQGDGTNMIGYANSTDGINWNKYPSPVLTTGNNGGWDDREINNLDVIFNGTNFIMWYGASGSQGDCVGVATSHDGISWTKYSGNPVLIPGPSSWDKPHIFPGAVFWNGTTYLMWYWGFNDQTTQVGLATSVDGLSWLKYEGNPMFGPGPEGSWDSHFALSYSVLEEKGQLMMWYVGSSEATGNEGIGLATSPTSISATVDFDPHALNIKSKGRWITAYIELPNAYDVANINVSTVELNGTISAELGPTAIGDQNCNGIPDLMIKVNRTEVVNLIVSSNITFGNITLTVSGQLIDGTRFYGSNVVRISSLIGDANCDGKVDLRDLLLVVCAYGSHQGDCRWNDNANFAQPWDIINIADLVKIACNYGKHYP